MALSSEQLERQAERARAQVADTLDELRSRISPGQVVDEIVDYAREGGIGDFARNLGNDMRTHPLPVALIGASLAWLMMANGRSARGSGAIDTRGTTPSAAAAAQRVGEGAAAVRRTASEASTSAAEASRSFFDFAKEQPLVLAGIGIAVGAAIGAALPSTETEDRLMGATSDEMKDQVTDIASERARKVQAVAEKAIDDAARAARDQGLGRSERQETALDPHRESSVVPSGDEGLHRPDGVDARR